MITYVYQSLAQGGHGGNDSQHPGMLQLLRIFVLDLH
jgi:hypothetical protein